MKKIFYIILYLNLSCVLCFAQKPCDPPGDDDGKPGCPDPKNCKQSPSPGPGGGGSGGGTNPNNASIPVPRAVDPNEVIGPTIYFQFIGNDTIKWVSGKQTLPYKILFENDPDFATAPAQNIRIDLPIHPKLNPASFRVGDFGFSNMEFTVPPNTVIYTKRLDVRDSLHVYVDVTAGIDIANRKAFWVFQAIDPATGLSTTVPAHLGVLPVNDSLSHRGEGFVTLTLLPVSTVQTRDSVTAQASIIFDTEETIVTNKWLNIIDAVAPTSNVSTVTRVDGNTARVNWTGQDDANGVGIDFYDLYVSKDNSSFQLYESRINANTYDFKGSSGSNYKFFTIASDLVGNKEALKNSANNTIFLGIAPPTIVASTDTACTAQSIILTASNCAGIIRWSNGQTGSSITVTITANTEFTANCTAGENASNESSPVSIIYGNALPTATLTGTQTINTGQSANLSLTFTGLAPWKFTINGQTTHNITTSPHQLVVSPTATTTYTLSSIGNGCGNFNVTTNNTAVVTVIGSQTLTTSAIGGSPFCAGAAVSVAFTAGGTFNSGNVFTAQLSNPGGSFTSGTTNIGTLSSTSTSGTISATIPANAVAGTTYRIRVLASNPALTGTDNGTNLTIRAKATATLSGTQTINSGQTATLSATLTGNNPWSITVNGQNYTGITSSPYIFTVSPTSTTTYTLTSVSDVCGAVIPTTNNTAIVTVLVDGSCIPQLVWDKTLGGSLNEEISSIISTNDGGYLLGGSSLSNISGDKSQTSKGGRDFWIVKVDGSGTKQWDKTYGGSNDDVLKKIVVTTDGFLLGGYSNSGISGDKTENSKGDHDYWLVKINATGEKQWDKTLGGSGEDYLADVLPIANNEFLIGGTSNSGISGNKSEASKGLSDFWVLKINSSGVKQWDKTYGGMSPESLKSILANNGNYLLFGESYSNISGDKSQDAKGVNDFWIVNINSTGAKVWDKTYGGSGADYFSQAINANDGGFLMGGFSYSALSGDKSEASKGANDYWIMKLNNAGSKEWDKTFGGTGYEELGAIVNTSDGNYLIGGKSSSNVSGDKTANSYNNTYDYWTLKVTNTGQKLWDKTIGTLQEDYFSNLISLSDGTMLLAGGTNGGISGDKTGSSKGGYDYWLVKMQENCCVGKPDIIVSDVSITKYTPDRIYYTAQIKNVGLASADMGSFFLGVYTSGDALVNSNDVQKYAVTTGGGSLAPNQILSFSYSSGFSFTDNQYYLRLKADELGLLTECKENNNDLFRLVNKCTSTDNLTLTGNISSGYYSTNKAVIVSNASLSNNVLVVGKSITGNPALTALSSIFMIGGCLNAPASVQGNGNNFNSSASLIEFLESDSKQTVQFSASEELKTSIYIWNATTKSKVATIQSKGTIKKGLNMLNLSSYNLNTSDIFILNIETSIGIYAKVIE